MTNFFHFKTDTRISVKVKEPEIEMSIIQRLKKPKFWVSDNDFDSIMNKIYKNSSKGARKIFSGIFNK